MSSLNSDQDDSKTINTLSSKIKLIDSRNFEPLGGIQLNISKIDEVDSEEQEDDSAADIDSDSNVIQFDLDEFARTDFLNFRDVGATKSLQTDFIIR